MDVIWRQLDAVVLDHLRQHGFTLPDMGSDYPFHETLWVMAKLSRVSALDGKQTITRDNATVMKLTGQYLAKSADVSPRECDGGKKLLILGS